ncbi:MAG: hypothetical protein U1U88_001685 [Lawsonella clevelandensis]
MGKVTRLVGYDFGGLTDIELSAAYTGAFVNEVLKSTGARKVDIVGYSEGGTVANLMAHNYGSAHFRKIVTIAGINVGINPFSVQDHNLIFTSPTQPALLGSIMTVLSDSTAQNDVRICRQRDSPIPILSLALTTRTSPPSMTSSW